MRINRHHGILIGLLPVVLLGQLGCAGMEIDWPVIAWSALPTVAASATLDWPLDAGPAATQEPPALAPALFIYTEAAPPTQTATPLPTAEATPSQAATAPEPEVIPLPSPTAMVVAAPALINPAVSLIGDSAGGRPLHSYRFGSGPLNVVLVGGMHGGYEENTILLAQAFLAHFSARVNELPAAITLHIIPNANPDGLAAITGEGATPPAGAPAGRVNANGVDLNRNWDCNWAEQAFWRDQMISAGPYPFSEPESESLQRYFLAVNPVVVVFLHSAAGAVYSAGCPEPDPASSALAAVYGLAADYPVYSSFDHYTITGDASDWLTTQGIPAFTVELTTHDTTDWEQNLAGLSALLAHLAEGQDTAGPNEAN